jgi:hypothetical protein
LSGDPLKSGGTWTMSISPVAQAAVMSGAGSKPHGLRLDVFEELSF